MQAGLLSSLCCLASVKPSLMQAGLLSLAFLTLPQTVYKTFPAVLAVPRRLSAHKRAQRRTQPRFGSTLLVLWPTQATAGSTQRRCASQGATTRSESVPGIFNTCLNIIKNVSSGRSGPTTPFCAQANTKKNPTSFWLHKVGFGANHDVPQAVPGTNRPARATPRAPKVPPVFLTLAWTL